MAPTVCKPCKLRLIAYIKCCLQQVLLNVLELKCTIQGCWVRFSVCKQLKHAASKVLLLFSSLHICWKISEVLWKCLKSSCFCFYLLKLPWPGWLRTFTDIWTRWTKSDSGALSCQPRIISLTDQLKLTAHHKAHAALFISLPSQTSQDSDCFSE